MSGFRGLKKFLLILWAAIKCMLELQKMAFMLPEKG